MNVHEKEKIVKAWAKTHVLCGIVDPGSPEEFFPKGRLPIAYNQALGVFRLLDSIVSDKNFQNGNDSN